MQSMMIFEKIVQLSLYPLSLLYCSDLVLLDVGKVPQSITAASQPQLW